MAVVNSNPSMISKVVASSVAIARRSGVIIRGIMKGGDLGIVDKVYFKQFFTLLPLFRSKIQCLKHGEIFYV